MNFDCPHCGQPASGELGLLGEEVEYPTCGEKFVVGEKLKPLDSKEKVRALAQSFQFFCLLAFVATGILLFIALFAAIKDEHTGDYLPPLIGAGGCLVLAFVLFLTAQLIHIRANTEK